MFKHRLLLSIQLVRIFTKIFSFSLFLQCAAEKKEEEIVKIDHVLSGANETFKGGHEEQQLM